MSADLNRTVAELEERERALVFDSFDNDDAWVLGNIVVSMAKDRDLPIVVSIRRGGQLLFHHARPGTTPDNDAWVARKSRVAERFHQSSYLMRQRSALEGRTFEERTRLDPAEYAAHGGSVPIRVARVGVVGSLTVSGLPDYRDHEVACEAIETYLGSVPATSVRRDG
jgi:uncharacterized protein (UPF0303 family)